MADRAVDVLLVGGGPASASCARELRARGLDGSIVIAGRELDPPYDRPPCSKEYLRSPDAARSSLALEIPGDVEVLTRCSVLKLDTEAKVARLADKSEIAYGQALVATGANVRRLPVDGSQLEGIHYLRAPGNAEAIRADLASLAPGADVVVVGGSYLGTELAASITTMGFSVTILMQEAVPMALAFGEAAGEWYRALLEGRGVKLVGSDALAGFAGSERVAEVRTEAGSTLPAALVVVAAGAVPDVMLAKGSGLEIGETGGVRCDASLRTSAQGVFAAGDCCEYHSALHGRRVRVEHWDVAEAHGRTAARGMLGEDVVHDVVPYFWSDLSDWASMEYVGVVGTQGWASEIVRGDVSADAFTVWLLGSDDRVLGAMTVGRGDDLDRARELIASREPVDAGALPA